jgi:hypothetical protein
MSVYHLGNGADFFNSAGVPDWTNDSAVFGGNGADNIVASALSPTFTSRLLVDGGNGRDTLHVDAGNSFVLGGNGADTLTITGGLGNTLDGGNGRDKLISVGGGSGMGEGNTLTGGNGRDTFALSNLGNLVVTNDAGADGVVSEDDIFLGPTDVITDYQACELISIGAQTRISEVELTVPLEDPSLPEGSLRPVLGDGEYAILTGNFLGEGQFSVDPDGDDLLAIYDVLDGTDEPIAQGSVALLDISDFDFESILIA